MTQLEMSQRFTSWSQESTRFIFSKEWVDMSWAERDAVEAQINAKHHYRHGWICVDGHSFDMQMAYPDQQFWNVFD